MTEFRVLDAGCIENKDVVEMRMGLPGQPQFPMDLYKNILEAHRAIRPQVEVSEAEIAAAMRQLAEKEHLMVEGSAWSCAGGVGSEGERV